MLLPLKKNYFLKKEKILFEKWVAEVFSVRGHEYTKMDSEEKSIGEIERKDERQRARQIEKALTK